MANYNTLKAAIEAVIRTNGNEEITGAILQDSLIAMINALGLGYQYMGVATPGPSGTNPGTPDQKVFYIALAAGTYTNFGGATVRQGITILKWDTAWTANELFSFAGSYTFTGNINFANSVSITSFEEFFDELNETSLRNELDNLIPRVYSAHDGNIPIFDEYGNVIDGGKSIQDIFDEINKAAKPTGIYEKMVAGSARGILSPSAIEELFLFQRTANGAGGTGAAVFQSIKGNSVVVNQMIPQFDNPVTISDVTFTPAAAGIIDVDGTASADATFYLTSQFTLLNGRSYIARGCPAGGSATTYSFRDSVAGRVNDTGSGQFITRDSDGACRLAIVVRQGTSVSHLKFRPEFIDVTRFAISGITSLAAFNAFYPYYLAPNPGAILNNAATGMVTDGFNQWDEETAKGYWAVGGWYDNDAVTSAKNLIPVFPSTSYYIKKATQATLYFYDMNKAFISSILNLANQAVTTPANCAYIGLNGVTIGNDCVNLSGARNGQYEPHWSDTTALPITTATGKLNGEGESVVVSPNGLAGVGTSFDEGIVEKGMWTKDIIRRARVDMGTLNWSKEGDGVFMAFIADDMPASKLFLCSKFYTIQDPGYYNTGYSDKSLWADQRSNNHAIYVKDTAYATAAEFMAAMDGVMLDYPLATEQLYVLDTPVPVVARVDENGTQTILPQGVDENGTPMTAPFKASTQYPVKMGVAPIGQQSLVNLLEKMKSAGKIASYTMVWDAATGVYDFTIS